MHSWPDLKRMKWETMWKGVGQTAVHPDSLLIPFPLEAAPLETRKVSLSKEGGPGGRVWEAPPPHTTWPPPTSTYGLGGGERQQTAKPSQTGVGFHGNRGARRRGVLQIQLSP